jgi:hypothetical protein
MVPPAGGAMRARFQILWIVWRIVEMIIWMKLLRDFLLPFLLLSLLYGKFSICARRASVLQ